MIVLHTVKSRDDLSKGPCTNTLSKCKTGDRETAIVPEGSGKLPAEEPSQRWLFPTVLWNSLGKFVSWK